MKAAIAGCQTPKNMARAIVKDNTTATVFFLFISKNLLFFSDKARPKSRVEWRFGILMQDAFPSIHFRTDTKEKLSTAGSLQSAAHN
jgi:hypothetical protein